MKMKLAPVSLLCIFLISCNTSPKNSTLNSTGANNPPPQQARPNQEASTENLTLVPRGVDYSTPPQTIAFGSCANQNAPQPIWKTILKNDPDLFLFMGDNIYESESAPEKLREEYEKLRAIPEFREFRQKVPFLVTWDDHDFGKNDGGRDNPIKEVAKKEFVRFWPYIKDSISLNQPGIFHAKVIGGPLEERKKRRGKIVTKLIKKQPAVQVIMLDTRYFRSPLISDTPDPVTGKAYFKPNPDPQATLLGFEQWEWLEEQLKRPAEVRLIVSSIQLIPESHKREKWGNFPKEKERFLALLKKLKTKNVFILSGDRHFGVISKQDVKDYGSLYEVTASSLNKAGTIDEVDPSYLNPIYKQANFGLARIDWAKKKIAFELRDLNNLVIQSLELPLK